MVEKLRLKLSSMTHQNETSLKEDVAGVLGLQEPFRKFKFMFSVIQ